MTNTQGVFLLDQNSQVYQRLRNDKDFHYFFHFIFLLILAGNRHQERQTQVCS